MENLIVEKTIVFSGKIIELTRELKKQNEFDLARQLFKSGTSIGANVYEAQSAESIDDFVHKLKIADKESEETKYWLILVEKNFNFQLTNELMHDLLSIKRILGKIISSSKNRNKNQK